MVNKEKLLEAFGELVYAVAKIDGTVQHEEIEKMKDIFQHKKGGSEVIWSFNYEDKQNTSVKDAYEKALSVMIEFGAYEGYTELINILNEVAKASNGIDESERFLISRFEEDLKRGLQMIANRGKLMDAFGALIYALTKIDGTVQNEEIERIKALFQYKKGGEEIVWSFNYENKQNNSVKEAYEQALNAMIEFGPYEGYPELVRILKDIALSSDGVSESEKFLISRFEEDLERGLRIRRYED
ncbi:MAG: TerB family tellurite resistance protein [Thermoflexibacter sp.]|nr:TerB family tellurite resistance protein [Thermoflexibacter sp.]